MNNKALMSENGGHSSQETLSAVNMKLTERPIDKIEEKAKSEQAPGLINIEGKTMGEGRARTAEPDINAINKGSKLTGNLVVSQDLDITGDVEGDITSEESSNIFIRGTCKGNIRTKGSVEIDGDMSGGDIMAGEYVKVTGKFHGGKIQAKAKIHINGEFSGTLESNEIEVGSGARGTGEIVYREHLSIQKGARVEGRITRVETDRKELKQKSETDRKEGPAQKKGFFSKK